MRRFIITSGLFMLGMSVVLLIPAVQNSVIGAWKNLHITQAAGAAVGCSDDDRGRGHHRIDDKDDTDASSDEDFESWRRRERERMHREAVQRHQRDDDGGGLWRCDRNGSHCRPATDDGRARRW
jgi:hypothetical protein